MAFQSLYRRFRPQRFGEVIGQDHLVNAVRNAVVQERVAHAYLLSGPRGTGKTTTARLLAKALNCDDLGDGGEPCCACPSCLAIEHGSSMDLYELDAASNNGVDNIRALNEKVALGTPGRRKVYLLDEVHMLTPGAANALLKTLEEPPDHVVFILATTDPRKVLPTIRSRTQHFELGLIPADLLTAHVRDIAGRADVEIDDETVEHVVGAGRGSVRDALSALDLVIAAGGVAGSTVDVGPIVAGLAERDTAATLGAVARIVASGVDPRDLAEQMTRRLRDIFLVLMRVEPGQLPPGTTEQLGAEGAELGAAATVRALELIGAALVDMRQAPDPRLTLEVALVRLTAPDADPSPAALLQRIERLERAGGGATTRSAAAAGAREALERLAPPGDEPRSAPPQRPAGPEAAIAPPPPPPPGPEPGIAPPPAPEPAIAPPPPAPVPAAPALAPPEPAAPPPPAPAPAAPPESGPGPAPEPVTKPTPSSQDAPDVASPVTRDQLTMDWEHIRPELSARARSRFSGGRWLAVEGSTAVFALPNEAHRERCADVMDDVETVLAARYPGLSLRLVAEDAPDDDESTGRPSATGSMGATDRPATTIPPDDEVAVESTVPAEGAPTDSVSRITDAFPGAVVLGSDEGPGGRR